MENKIGVAAAMYDSFGIKQAARSISKIGYKYIELVYAKGFVEKLIKNPEDMNEADVKNILKICRENNITVYCLSVFSNYFMYKEGIKKLKKVLDTANLLNVNYVITDTGNIDDDVKKRTFFENIAIIADYAELKNITICFEIHGGWYCNGRQGSEIIKRINHPNIRLNYDTANVIYFGGGRPEGDIEFAKDYMSFMHLKDKAGKDNEWSFPALGDGSIDFKKIFKSITDYEGPMSIEIEISQGQHSLEEVNSAYKKSFDFMKSYGFDV